jgi:hypothetical protein
VAVDRSGFVLTGPAASGGPARPAAPLESSVPGVFAVGDVRSGSVKRVGGAIGEGAAVVAQIHHWPTPNGHKVHIMLEECGLPYRAHPVNIGAGDQFKPDFLAISPNNKIPAITDPDGPDGKPISLFESGAILVYLAGKTGRFLPEGDRAASRCCSG